METFTKEQMENDLRCRVAMTFAENIPNFKIHQYNGDNYITKDGTPKTCWVILSDGKNKSADLMFTNNQDTTDDNWVKFIVNKDDVYKQIKGMYPVPCLIEEVEYELQEISKHYR